MRYVMMTFVGTDHAEAWERATPDERQAEVDRTVAWFRSTGPAATSSAARSWATQGRRGPCVAAA